MSSCCARAIMTPRRGRQVTVRAARSRPLLECAPPEAAPESDFPVSFKELLDSWREQAAAPRTRSSYTVQLPLDDAARLAALAEMFPGRTREQLITELLGEALKEIMAAMPYVPGKRVISTDEHGDPVYEDTGPTPRFMALVRSHYAALEPPVRARATRRKSRTRGR
jgi:hypothetical protein